MVELNVYGPDRAVPPESRLAKSYYVPFGETFILHPKNFVLGVTLEWIRMPKKMAAYVVGKSSWGRYGLIIATATGVHPGFSGCLTLELANNGEIPINLRPGTSICQIFVHHVSGKGTAVDKSRFIGRRKPTILPVELDEVAIKLAKVKKNDSRMAKEISSRMGVMPRFPKLNEAQILIK